MMAPSQKFRFEVFEKNSSNSRKLALYLKVYAKNTNPKVRTSTNELLDDLATQSKNKIVIYFGLQENGKAIAFASVTYYRKARTAIFDEMAIEKDRRKNGTFFIFTENIHDFLMEKFVSAKYYLVEVSYGDTQDDYNVPGVLLTKLLKLKGFKVALAPYWMPHAPIIKNNEESKARLLIYDTQGYNNISNDDYLFLVKLIYFEHYFKWIQKYETGLKSKEFHGLLEDKLKLISKKIESKNHISLNGAKELLYLKKIERNNVAPQVVSLKNLIYVTIPALLTIALSAFQAPEIALILAIMLVLIWILARKSSKISKIFTALFSHE